MKKNNLKDFNQFVNENKNQNFDSDVLINIIKKSTLDDMFKDDIIYAIENNYDEDDDPEDVEITCESDICSEFLHKMGFDEDFDDNDDDMDEYEKNYNKLMQNVIKHFSDNLKDFPFTITTEDYFLLYKPSKIGNLDKYKPLPDENLDKQLLRSVKSNNLNVVKELIKNGADVNFRYGDNTLVSPLYIACQNVNLDIVKELIKNGADVNIINSSGYTPLHVVCSELLCEIKNEEKRLEIVKELLKNSVLNQ